MNNKDELQQKSVGGEFNIHHKLLTTNTHWSYSQIIQPHQDNAVHELRTVCFDEVEHAIYKREGEYMILVDFFKTYEEACDEAKEILNSFPKAKASVDAWTKQ